jgi:hypothetical protein
MVSSCAATALGFALPWARSAGGATWAFRFPEGWLAAAAVAAGLAIAAGGLPESASPSTRARLAALSLLCGLAVLGCTLAFAVRLLRGDPSSVGSGAGVIVAAAADLAWVFASARRHVALRRRT